MDNQKQIEGMAKKLCPHYNNGNCYYEVTEVCECCFGCEFCWAISQVLNAGYRKIDENAVVLTGMETEQRFEDLMVAFDEMGFMPNTTHPFPEEYVETWKQRLIFVFGQLRKETAEKFAGRLFDFLDDYALFDKRFLERKIDEICKEITKEKV